MEISKLRSREFVEKREGERKIGEHGNLMRRAQIGKRPKDGSARALSTLPWLQ